MSREVIGVGTLIRLSSARAERTGERSDDLDVRVPARPSASASRIPSQTRQRLESSTDRRFGVDGTVRLDDPPTRECVTGAAREDEEQMLEQLDRRPGCALR